MALSPPEALSEKHELSLFSCGKPTLDNWLKGRALSNQSKGFTAVVVMHENRRVVGYYGLAPTSVAATVLPRSIRTGQPPDPIPCLLLGQFAVDQSYGGRGIARWLLKDAYARCVSAAQLVGGRALLVNAVDDDAAAFWRHQGFKPVRDDPLSLYRSMADIILTQEKAGSRA